MSRSPRSRRILSAALVCGWMGLSVSLAGDAFLEYVLLVEASRGRHDLSVGVLGFLIGIPVLGGGVIGAVLDRQRRRRRSILSGSLLVAALATGMLALLWGGEMVAAVAYTVVLVLGLLSLVGTTLWQMIVPEFVEHDRDSVKRVIGWSATAFGFGAAVGPLLATTAEALLTAREMIIVDSATFVWCAALLAVATRHLGQGVDLDQGVDLHQTDQAQRAADASLEVAASRRWHGVRLLLSEPLVRAPMLTLAAMNFVTFGLAFAVPLLVVDRGWPNRIIAIGSSVFVLGGLAGSVVATRFRTDRHFIAYVSLEPAVRAVAVAVVLLAPSAMIAMLGLGMFTISQGMGRVARQSFLITSFPGRHRGTVIGHYQMVVRGLMPAAPLVMQGVADTLNIDAWLTMAGVGLALLTLLVLSDRGLRDAWAASGSNSRVNGGVGRP